METKRANSHSQKLKRSHSANTRTQSVRRTSIREKSQISRREAKEEGRLREKELVAQRAEEEDDIPLSNKSDQEVHLNGVDLNMVDAKSSRVKSEVGEKYNPSSPEEKSKEEPNQAIRSSQREDKEPSPSTSSDSVGGVQRSSSDSVKVEIHVTVNTSSPSYGTLADLKKHRSDQRRGSDKSSQGCTEMVPADPPPKNSDSKPRGTNNNSHMIRATYLLDSSAGPPSPSMTLKKFCGTPGEVVGGEPQRRGCCTIS